MPEHPMQHRAIRWLREYNNAEAQELGRALQFQYFPVHNSVSLQRRIDRFNQDTFKAHARPPLPDLRDQIRQDKADRPLLHGELVRWLVDRGQQEGLTGPEQEARLIACGFDWEGNGVLSQSGMHEILRLLGYLRG